MLASKVTDSVFYFSTTQDFQSELIFINKAFQSAVTQNQRNNKDNPTTSCSRDTWEGSGGNLGGFKYLCDLAAITQKVKVARYQSEAGSEGSGKDILESYDNVKLHK